MRERRENHRAGVDVGQVTLDELTLPALPAATELPPHRIDRREPRRGKKLGGPTPVLLRIRRAGQIDAFPSLHCSGLEYGHARIRD